MEDEDIAPNIGTCRLDQLYVYVAQWPRLPFCVLFYIELIVLCICLWLEDPWSRDWSFLDQLVVATG